MSVYDEIFPAKRRLEYVQTEWSAGWTAGTSGFGYAAEFLTKHARSFGATIDQAGLAVFFLQRHRVELVLKDLLNFFGIKFKSSHSLQYLWGLCEQGFTESELLDWAEFDAENGEFVRALIAVDDGAATFRFPVDRQGQEAKRPDFIDLEALNRHAEVLENGASGCVDYVGELGAEAASAEADYGSDEVPRWEEL
jgi:hypothetical protein